MIDTHAHLDQLTNLPLALENASQRGVKAIVSVSMDLASCQKNLQIRREFSAGTNVLPRIYLAMGMHPSEANREGLPACLQFIREQKPMLTAVGEIGLDFWYKWVKKDEDKKEEQREIFSSFLKLAKELHLPVIIHSRGAWHDCLQAVQRTGVPKAVFHWYSGPLDVLEEILSAGFYVSASPSIAYSPQSREAMLKAPLQRILIETDCPVRFTDPDTQESFQSEPGDVFRAFKALCLLKNLNPTKALEILTQNAKDFFSIS